MAAAFSLLLSHVRSSVPEVARSHLEEIACLSFIVVVLMFFVCLVRIFSQTGILFHNHIFYKYTTIHTTVYTLHKEPIGFLFGATLYSRSTSNLSNQSVRSPPGENTSGAGSLELSG